MRGRVVAYAVAAVALVTSANSAFAHHPFSAEYDVNKPVTLMGTITRVNWENPHTFVFVDVKDAAGAVSNWKVELGSPVALTATSALKSSKS